MNILTEQDLRFVVSRIPSAIRALMKNHEISIAGGFVRAIIAGEQPSDYDVFGSNKDTLKLVAMKLKDEYGETARIFESDNATTLLCPPRVPVQFISRWLFDSLETCVDSFDFTVCRAGVAWNHHVGRWHSYVDDSFYSDLAARRLVYTAPKRNEDCGGSLLRVRKYLSRGYTIQADSLAAVVARLVRGCNQQGQPPLHALDEAQTAKVLCGKLREVDPLTIIDGFEAVHEDGHEYRDPAKHAYA